MPYATYEYYTTDYPGGLIPAGDFPGYIKRASAYVSQATFRRLDDTAYADIPDSAKDAACAVAEALYRYDSATGRQVESEKIGDYSVSYLNAPADPDGCRSEVTGIIRAYLGGSGAMRRGVDVVCY